MAVMHGKEEYTRVRNKDHKLLKKTEKEQLMYLGNVMARVKCIPTDGDFDVMSNRAEIKVLMIRVKNNWGSHLLCTLFGFEVLMIRI